MRNVKKVICPHCGKEISKSNFTKHLRRHDKHPETFNKNIIHLDHEGLHCKYCGKLCKNRNSLIQHEIRCKNNIYSLCAKDNTKGHPCINKGKNKDNSESIRKQMQTYQRNKLLGLHKDTSGENNSMKKHPEARIKISKTCLEKSKNGEWHKSLAKNNHYRYKGIDLDCKWELEYAKYLDENNINWRRPKERFKYIYQDKEHYYTPDFYIEDTKEYIEIKGYTTGKDYSKWKMFPENLKLKVLKRKELLDLGINIK